MGVAARIPDPRLEGFFQDSPETASAMSDDRLFPETLYRFFLPRSAPSRSLLLPPASSSFLLPPTPPTDPSMALIYPLSSIFFCFVSLLQRFSYLFLTWLASCVRSRVSCGRISAYWRPLPPPHSPPTSNFPRAPYIHSCCCCPRYYKLLFSSIEPSCASYGRFHCWIFHAGGGTRHLSAIKTCPMDLYIIIDIYLLWLCYFVEAVACAPGADACVE